MLKSKKMKFWYRPNFLAIAALIIISIPALLSLSTSGFYTSHDGETHTARIAQYFLALKDGQIPPRFAPSLYNGLGSPIFVYIYPLPYALGSLVHSFGASYVNSFKILMALGFIFSTFFSYLWLLEVFESEKAAALGAIFYAWVPYRFLLIYVRASVSELLAYTFLPLALFSFTKLAKSGNIFWICASAISTSLMLLSQNLVALITLPVLTIYILLIALNGKSFSFLLKSVVAFIWTFLISSVTYLPTLFERKFVRLDEIINTAYANHFVTLGQLFHSPWGYGFDMPGTINDQLSFQIGLAHILVFIISILSVIYLAKRTESLPAKIYQLALFFIFIFLVSVFLMLNIKPNTYIWQHLKILHTIDIPWRFLGMTSISLAYLAAFVAKTVKPGIVFLVLIALVIIANRNHLRINESVQRPDQFFENYTGTATQYNEFTPITRETTSSPDNLKSSQKTHVLDGDAEITNTKINSKNIYFDANVKSKTSLIRIDKFYFPKVQSDIGQVYSSNTRTKKLDGEKDGSGIILANLPSGFHKVSIKYEETELRLFAGYLSLISLLLAVVILAKNVKKA